MPGDLRTLSCKVPGEAVLREEESGPQWGKSAFLSSSSYFLATKIVLLELFGQVFKSRVSSARGVNQQGFPRTSLELRFSAAVRLRTPSGPILAIQGLVMGASFQGLRPSFCWGFLFCFYFLLFFFFLF